MFLTLLITEGRTPEYSVKGRTEGLHCPPAQSAMPPLHKHECSDKLPQVAHVHIHISVHSLSCLFLKCRHKKVYSSFVRVCSIKS